MKVKDIRSLEKEGRSPVKTVAEMYRTQKRPFKGWRIALSRDFPELLSNRRDENGSPIPPDKLHLRTLSPNTGEKEPIISNNIGNQTHKNIMKLPKDQANVAKLNVT